MTLILEHPLDICVSLFPLNPPLFRTILRMNSPDSRLCRLLNKYYESVDINADSPAQFRNNVKNLLELQSHNILSTSSSKALVLVVVMYTIFTFFLNLIFFVFIIHDTYFTVHEVSCLLNSL